MSETNSAPFVRTRVSAAIKRLTNSLTKVTKRFYQSLPVLLHLMNYVSLFLSELFSDVVWEPRAASLLGIYKPILAVSTLHIICLRILSFGW